MGQVGIEQRSKKREKKLDAVAKKVGSYLSKYSPTLLTRHLKLTLMFNGNIIRMSWAITLGHFAIISMPSIRA